jgi:hypothetical protein
MNPFGKNNENNQKTPEVRRLSVQATEIFLNTAQPQYYQAAKNLQNTVSTVVMPEAFSKVEDQNNAVNGTMGAMALEESNA